MSDIFYKPYKARTIRSTRLVDDCCSLPPEDTECIINVIDAFTTFSLEPNSEDGERAFERKANGDVCINEREDDILQDLTVNLLLCQIPASFITGLTGWPLVTDADGNGVGFDIMEGANTVRSALEMHTGVSGVSCAEGARYGYNVLPCTTGWTLGDTLEWGGADTIFAISLTGRTSGNHDWGTGPYAVQSDVSGDPGPLIDPIQQGAHARLMVTDVAPPTVTDGCVAASAANGYLFPPAS
jgi:hypothetical protein